MPERQEFPKAILVVPHGFDLIQLSACAEILAPAGQDNRRDLVRLFQRIERRLKLFEQLHREAVEFLGPANCSTPTAPSRVTSRRDSISRDRKSTRLNSSH